MPIIDRRTNLTSNNARASDVAARAVEQLAPIQQQKIQAAFRVQGMPGILYSRLSSGMRCTCKSKNNEVITLSPDGKASPGAINRAIVGGNFGISDYDPLSPEDEFSDLSDAPTSPNDAGFTWQGNSNNLLGVNQFEDEPSVGDNGQQSPDLEDMFKGFDLSDLGLTDVSCPICYGTNFVGGYQSFRNFRFVAVPSIMQTNSYLELPDISLSPGTHTFSLVLPKGAFIIDAFRAMNGNKVAVSKFYIDNQDLTSVNPLNYFDGHQHSVTVTTAESITHVEIQAGLSNQSIYFEFPKRTKSQDISLLDQSEPFQIVVSPEVPNLQVLDVIAESQLGKFLIVQNVSPWNTRNRQVLGWDCQVRVAQPQELFRLLPMRRHVTGQKAVKSNAPRTRPKTSGFFF
jgi:hypothetical protein